MSNTRNWGSLHSEFACEFMVQSNHDLYTLEITFCGAQNLFCSHHRIKNCPTLEIGIQCIQNLHVNLWYSQIMTALPQKLLFAVHRNIIRYFHFGPMEKQMNQITAIFISCHFYCNFNCHFICHFNCHFNCPCNCHSGSQELEIINYFRFL